MRTDAAGSGVTDLRSWACSAAGAMQPANQAGPGARRRLGADGCAVR